MQSRIDSTELVREISSARDPYLHLSFRRSTLYAFLGSILFHVLALFVIPQQRVGPDVPFAKTGESLVVNLRPRTPSQDMQSSSVAVPEDLPQSPVGHRPKAPMNSIVAINKARTKDLPPQSSPTIPAVAPPPTSEPPTDMQTYVNAARARRRATNGVNDREYPEAASYEPGPSEDEIRIANVKRNLKSGTNGVFQILSMESRTAAFSFRGWTTDSNNSRREYIQVEIGTNSDIEIAIVRKMIELIRRYFKGNFNWESQRLDRIIILSARPEDNEGLEGFLVKEFFGAQSRTTRVR